MSQYNSCHNAVLMQLTVVKQGKMACTINQFDCYECLAVATLGVGDNARWMVLTAAKWTRRDGLSNCICHISG